MESVNENKTIHINGEDFCFFENKEGTIVGFTTISNASTIPLEAVAFTYAHQSDENKFLRAYRIGKRLKKSVFDYELLEAAKEAGNHSLVTYSHNSDYCMFPTSEKAYFFAINDDDVVVEDREQLETAFLKAIETKGTSVGKVQVKK